MSISISSRRPPGVRRRLRRAPAAHGAKPARAPRLRALVADRPLAPDAPEVLAAVRLAGTDHRAPRDVETSAMRSLVRRRAAFSWLLVVLAALLVGAGIGRLPSISPIPWLLSGPALVLFVAVVARRPEWALVRSVRGSFSGGIATPWRSEHRLACHRHLLRGAGDLADLRSSSRARRWRRRRRSTTDGPLVLRPRDLALSRHHPQSTQHSHRTGARRAAALRDLESGLDRSVRRAHHPRLPRDLRCAERSPHVRSRPLAHLVRTRRGPVEQSRRRQQQEHDGSARRDHRHPRDRGPVASPLGPCRDDRRRTGWAGVLAVHRLDRGAGDRRGLLRAVP